MEDAEADGSVNIRGKVAEQLSIEKDLSITRACKVERSLWRQCAQLKSATEEVWFDALLLRAPWIVAVVGTQCGDVSCGPDVLLQQRTLADGT